MWGVGQGDVGVCGYRTGGGRWWIRYLRDDGITRHGNVVPPRGCDIHHGRDHGFCAGQPTDLAPHEVRSESTAA